MYFTSTKAFLIKVSFLFLFFSMSLSCQNNGTSISHNSHNTAIKKYSFKLQPQPGSAYYYTIHNITDIDIDLNSKKVNNQNDVTVGLIYNINKDSAGNFLFKITYDSFHVVIKKDGQTMEFDASNGAYAINSVEKMLAILKGNSLFITIDKQGKVMAVNGYQEIADRLVEEMKITDIIERRQIQSQLAAMAGEGFIKNNIEQNFNFFPDSSLAVGDTWNKNITASTELGLSIPATYKFSSVDDDIATIKSTSDINTENQKINVTGNEVTASLKGSESGKVKLEIKTGMVTRATSNVSIKGNIQVMGKEVPLKIKVQRTIEGRTDNVKK